MRVSGVSSQIYLLPLSEDYQVAGEPDQLTRDPGFYAAPVWTLDGREIVFVFGTMTSGHLFRISVSGSDARRPLNFFHQTGRYPALSAKKGRLAFVERRGLLQIVRVELPRPGVSEGTASKGHPFISSTRLNASASYSHDGKMVAFVSHESGGREICVCNSDGKEKRRLTFFNLPEVAVNRPRLSPDGKQVVFICPLEGNNDICVVSSGGGDSRNLTKHTAHDGPPSWSRDGEWIYFSSDRTGEKEIWKIPAAGGGRPSKVTENGGGFALESPDGQTLYFSRDADGQRSLWTMPAGGGEEIYVSALRGISFAVADLGVYFLSDDSTFQFLPFDTGKAIPVSPAPDLSQAYLTSVSPDGRWALLQRGELLADLKLVENFH